MPAIKAQALTAAGIRWLMTAGDYSDGSGLTPRQGCSMRRDGPVGQYPLGFASATQLVGSGWPQHPLGPCGLGQGAPAGAPEPTKPEQQALAGLGLLCDLQNYPATVRPRVPEAVSLRGRREKVVQPPRQQMPCILGQAKDNRFSCADLIHEV